RLIDTMKFQTEEDSMSTWVRDYKIPDKATLEASYDESRAVAFGNAQLSESHKYKRKSRYMEKAKIQASACGMVNAAYTERDQAKDAFLTVAPRVQVEEKDISFMQDWSAYCNTGEYANGQLDMLSDIFSEDEKKQQAEARNLYRQILAEDISEYNYKNDMDFLHKFRDKYKTLCAFSNAQKIIDILDPVTPEEDILKLQARVDALRDIRADYENRMQILQSPYYALLMEEDLSEDLEKLKLEKGGNPVFDAYYAALKNKDSIKFKKGDSAADLEQEYLTEYEKTLTQGPQVQDSVLRLEHSKMLSEMEELRTLQETYKGEIIPDTQELVSLKHSILVINSVLSGTIVKGDKFDDERQIILDSYQDVIDNCKKYIETESANKKKDKTGIRKRKMELVSAIQRECEGEMSAFSLTKEVLNIEGYADEAKWTDVLYGIRAESISEKDSHITKMGAGASVIYRVEDEYETSYVKEEEHLITDESISLYLEAYRNSGAPEAELVADFLLGEIKKRGEKFLDLVGAVYRGAFDSIETRVKKGVLREDGESDEDYKARKRAIETKYRPLNITLGYYRSNMPKSVVSFVEKHQEAFADFTLYYYKKENERSVAFESGIEVGAVMSSRNVSTSRIAQRLHMTDMVAKSKTIMMKKDNGQIVRANSMEGVETMSMADLQEHCRFHGITIKMSGKSIRQLYSLQMMDVICGQTDRHTGNYNVFYEQTDDKHITVTSIKAIDNDMAFGHRHMDTIASRKRLRGVVDEKGILTVPFLDKEFYDSLMAYDEETAEHDQIDLRTPEEIEALKTRLRLLKKALSDREKDGSLIILEHDTQWDAVIPRLEKMYADGLIGVGYPFMHEVLGNG
ncbi:MAG: hypothetical protein IIZ61_02485, partial [Lachnospiraceae bacterium]|nr:hypothetical protein [Lachnospiraceae bacterium]